MCLRINGGRWHTSTIGVSFFAFLPLDAYVISRFMDPIECVIIEALVSLASEPLGLWVIFAASGWRMHKQITNDKARCQQTGLLDGILDSEAQIAIAEHFRVSGAGSATVKPLSMEDTAGIPTGLAHGDGYRLRAFATIR